VDCMLGKLAKWLRILGFDTLYDPAAGDDRILNAARREGRILLTRDTALLARAGTLPKLAVASESWPEQVRQVLDAFDLRGAASPHSLCLDCNVRLKPLERAAAANLVPSFVLERAGEFALCPVCGRVFWPGTHFEAMEARLAELLRDPPETGQGKSRT
ncbi:MAG: hypothetical protein FJY83_06150, partial [Candidatus Aminicenantes bacterium]|nr:hypothetical protein [Candidatus Aminicenantes bacterium]